MFPKCVAGRCYVINNGGRWELSAKVGADKASSFSIARVRNCRIEGVTHDVGNAQKLVAGWNALSDMRTEDVAAAARIADAPPKDMDPGVVRILQAVTYGIRYANKIRERLENDSHS